MSAAAPTPKTRRPASTRLRRGVGLLLINHQGLILAGLRHHNSGHSAWQLPQGGLEYRENPLTAAYRELKEETGIPKADVELIATHPAWTTYILPPEFIAKAHFKGQRHKWYIFKYLPEDLPDLSRAQDKEFTKLQWVTAAWLYDNTVNFRQPIYREIFRTYADLLA